MARSHLQLGMIITIVEEPFIQYKGGFKIWNPLSPSKCCLICRCNYTNLLLVWALAIYPFLDKIAYFLSRILHFLIMVLRYFSSLVLIIWWRISRGNPIQIDLSYLYNFRVNKDNWKWISHCWCTHHKVAHSIPAGGERLISVNTDYHIQLDNWDIFLLLNIKAAF